uniref:P-type domain-containing protein n=1 Tax=Calidris pygmaea TaxID=425635 RepID=A0A8C3K3F7_9CHAR
SARQGAGLSVPLLSGGLLCTGEPQGSTCSCKNRKDLAPYEALHCGGGGLVVVFCCSDGFFPPCPALGRCLGADQEGQCSGVVAKRIDCHPQPGATQEICEARGCSWCPTDVTNAPWCFFPEDTPYGYSLGGSTEQTTKGWR